MNTDALGWFLAGIGALSLSQTMYRVWREWRAATPREPNPEPGPRVTPESLKTDGLPGLHEKRAEILRRLKREHIELQMLDPDDDGFSDEYDQRIDRKHNLHQQLFAIDMMLKGRER